MKYSSSWVSVLLPLWMHSRRKRSGMPVPDGSSFITLLFLVFCGPPTNYPLVSNHFVYIVPVWTSIYTLTNIYTTSSSGCQIISAVKHFSYVFSTFELSQEIQSTHYCWILLVTDVVKRRTFSELPNCFLYFSSVLFCIAPIGGLWCHCTSTFCQVPARPPCVISCLALMRYTCVSSFSLFLYLVSDLPVYLHSTVFALVGDFK